MHIKLFMCAALASALAMPQLPAQAASRAYTAPKVTFTVVKAPAALAGFVKKMTEAANSEASEAELAALFSDDTEILTGGVSPQNQRLKSSGRFDGKSPKLVQAAKAMEEGERPPGYSIEKNARDNVWRFLAENADRKVVLGPQPGQPGRLCWGPVLSIDVTALTNAQAQISATNGRLNAIVAPLKVFAKDDEASAVLETLPAKTAVNVLQEGNGGMWQVQTPSGRKGFVDQTLLLDIYGNGVCFARQKDGAWLIDAVVVRGN